jgi:uncharacterized membrane protein
MITAVLAAITGYNVSLFIHIAAVVIGLGATFAESIMFPVAMKLDPRHLPYVHSLQLAINRYMASPALLVIIITGIYQVSEGNWDFGDFWISATFVIVIVIGAVNGAYFIPTDRKLGPMVGAEVAAAGGGEFTLSDDYQRRARIEGMVGGLVGALVLLAIFLMVAKPGA